MRIKRAMMVGAGFVLSAAACGSTSQGNGYDAGSSSQDQTTGGDAGSGGGGGQLSSDGSSDAAGCTAPDLLVVLDRTLSMSKTPNGMKPDNTPAGRATSKWALAVDALDTLVAPPRDSTIRFGLELFPENPEADGGSDMCPTLPELLDGQNASNPKCQPGQIISTPTIGNGPNLTVSIGQDTTPLCVSTPIGGAMQTASDSLAGVRDGTRSQFVVLVTDGGETCDVDSIPIVQALAAQGVKTFVVGFGQDGDGGDKGVNVKLLNDLACAGLTAQNFASSCSLDSDGGYEVTSGTKDPVFFAAQDGTSLSDALGSISKQVCCNCPR
ncbi:MAG: VWA domain-containing protein [Polyangiaceae bacterium]